jgi:hypothetical protein
METTTKVFLYEVGREEKYLQKIILIEKEKSQRGFFSSPEDELFYPVEPQIQSFLKKLLLSQKVKPIEVPEELLPYADHAFLITTLKIQRKSLNLIWDKLYKK